VEEIFRVLKPGGRFNVHAYSLWSYFTLSRVLKHGRHWRLWFENSRDPVHIDFYTARKLRSLFSPAKVTIEKHGCLPAPVLSPLVGFFLVTKGKKP
nr:hypothetical protein [Acidobacteriota bacterium]